MPCISNSGEKINITPPLLFRFQYIDQDEGWNKIADSFRNSAYIHDWKPNTNKYVCGYLDDKYYELKAQKEEYISEKNDKEIALENNNSFVTRISNSIKQMNDIESVEEVTNNTKTLFEKAEKLRKILFSINEQIILLENDIYINENKLRIVQYNQEESKKDIEFAMNQNNEIICPICGASYSNNLDNQLNITSDYSHCEKLIQELKGDIVISKTKLKELKNEYDSMALKIKMIEKDIHDSQELLSYSLFYKNRGQWEIYESCQKELEVLQTEIESLSLKINNTDKKINEKKSRKRSKEIQEEIKKYCRILADEINLPKTFIKLRDFVQVIDRTGSETPRLVYMYQSALYLYNLDKGISPFNFYVIDTPNQQGQDAENLESIFKSLEIFMNNRGQVIVGTERKTGLEKKVSNVIVLKEKRRCLNSDNFTNHLMLFKTLQKVANEWRNENIIRNK